MSRRVELENGRRFCAGTSSNTLHRIPSEIDVCRSLSTSNFPLHHLSPSLHTHLSTIIPQPLHIRPRNPPDLHQGKIKILIGRKQRIDKTSPDAVTWSSTHSAVSLILPIPSTPASSSIPLSPLTPTKRKFPSPPPRTPPSTY